MVAQLERDTCEWREGVQRSDRDGGKRKSAVVVAAYQMTTKNILTVLVDGGSKGASAV